MVLATGVHVATRLVMSQFMLATIVGLSVTETI